MDKELQTTAGKVRQTAIPVPAELSDSEPVVIVWLECVDYMEILTGWEDTAKVHNIQRYKADFEYLLKLENQ
jgi:hypothetical protein